jgi:hypothetical protein
MRKYIQRAEGPMPCLGRGFGLTALRVSNVRDPGPDGPGWYGFGPSAFLYTGIICDGKPEQLLRFLR